jgi:hypothetical protein
MNPRNPAPARGRGRAALALLAAVAALWATGAGAAHAASPWWQITSGSLPTNLTAPPTDTEVQELTTTPLPGVGFGGRVEVAGQTVGCLGTGTGAALCVPRTGFAAVADAAGLEAMLEALPSYGPGVQVSGGPVGEAPFTVTTPGAWPPALHVSPLPFSEEVPSVGSASTRVTSEGSGRLTVVLANLGDAPLDAGAEPLSIEDRLPEGLAAYKVLGVGGSQGKAGPVDCALDSPRRLSCGFEGVLNPYESIDVEVYVVLDDPPADGAPGEVRVSGGGAPAASAEQTVRVSGETARFGLQAFRMRAEEEGGAQTSQAGVHPFQVTSTLQVSSSAVSGDRPSKPGFSGIEVQQPALTRNARVTFPAGLVGAARPTPRCPLATFLNTYAGINKCAPETAVGVAAITFIEPSNFHFVRFPVPVFSLPPEHGEPARLGFMIAANPILIDTRVDPADEYRIVGEVRNATQVVKFISSTITLWGVPGDPRHDSARGWGCTYVGAELVVGGPECEPLATHEQTPFLRMPTRCDAPLDYEAEVEPWNVPVGSVIDRAPWIAPRLRGCNQAPFDPTLAASPTSRLASNPSGLDLGIEMPGTGLQSPKDGAVSEAQFKRAEIAFPRGVTVNPSIAEGLAVCGEAQYESERYDSRPGEGCPEASKIGSVQISTPLLDERAQGAVYQATPYENPTHSLIGLYLVAKIPDRGILVKQPIEVRPDPRTGQLVSVAEDVPQLPFSSFDFHFREGGRSPLITPPGCGSFHTVARFVPWSARDPEHPDPEEVVERRASFTIDHGVDGGGCPTGPAPFAPGFQAGTLNNQAGSYSPFFMRLTRSDGEQDMGRFSFTLPPGVLARLAGVPYCPEAGIARARARQGAHGGQEEIDHPSCPAASQIGRTVAGAGVGNQLTYVKGSLYLAGPWHGDPLSVVAITPAVAGPFDAGTVVVREALRLNPTTARAEVDGSASDPIPHILKGIPLNLRDLRVFAERPGFTLNATSCEPSAAESTIWGDGTALEPLAPHPVGLSARYQAAGCAGLGFKPRLGLRLKGGTRRGAFPALRAAYVPKRRNQANLERLALTFPDSEFIEQGHFRTICTRVQFAAGAGFGKECPRGSIYGRAKVWSPLLAEPLQGPVYLRSSNHNLPDAVLALHGLLDIEVAVRIDSTHGRLRAIVSGAPDAPVSRAVVNMRGGQKGLFVNSRNLCRKAKRNRARVNAKGHNGRRELLGPRMRALGCGKAKRRAHGSHARAARLARHGGPVTPHFNHKSEGKHR